jgi:hypothetical protein
MVKPLSQMKHEDVQFVLTLELGLKVYDLWNYNFQLAANKNNRPKTYSSFLDFLNPELVNSR